MALSVFARPTLTATSYRLEPGATLSVDEHGTCRRLYNSGAAAAFVPTRTAAEWASFYGNPPAAVSVSACTCGNGVLDAGEACDDFNRASGDGCSADCSAEEIGYDCPIPGDACLPAACGDGIRVSPEACDDGNTAAYDGCDRFCQLEAGFFCPSPGQPCLAAVCGDGLVQGLETCDDGVGICDDAPISIEAESFDSVRAHGSPGHLWTVRSDHPGYSGSGYIEAGPVTPDVVCSQGPAYDGFCGSLVRYSFTVRVAGLYYFHFRTSAASSNDDSWYWGIDKLDGILAANPDDGTWVWTTAPAAGPTQLTTGVHALSIWMRENGQKIDRIVISPYANPLAAGISCSASAQCSHACVARSGDGCSAFCQTEAGYACPSSGGACSPTTCGNLVLEGIEQCEDGNATDGDGCDRYCRLEKSWPHWSCPVVGAPCVRTICGDGVRQGTEACDDGGLCSGDGATPCTSNANCSAAGGSCLPRAGDGCSPTCAVEGLHTCSAGAGCGPRCGDGVTLWFAGEECDDGNLASGDGCSAACTIEPGYSCTDFSSPLGATVGLPLTVRDFRGYNELGSGDGYPDGRGHADFERYGCAYASTGLVARRLGVDGTPVLIALNGPPCNQRIVTGSATFSTWYRDAPGVNRTLGKTLTLHRDLTADPSGQAYTFDSANPALGGTGAGFFPINGEGYGNTPGLTANYHFTDRLTVRFRYRGGEMLSFSGDDDVWVFINGYLAMDLGGSHAAQSGSVTLSSSVDPAVGVVADARFEIFAGGVYEMTMFHAERRTQFSSFRLTLKNLVDAGTAICTTP